MSELSGDDFKRRFDEIFASHARPGRNLRRPTIDLDTFPVHQLVALLTQNLRPLCTARISQSFDEVFYP